mgnify:CR=1 FL=1
MLYFKINWLLSIYNINPTNNIQRLNISEKHCECFLSKYILLLLLLLIVGCVESVKRCREISNQNNYYKGIGIIIKKKSWPFAFFAPQSYLNRLKWRSVLNNLFLLLSNQSFITTSSSSYFQTKKKIIMNERMKTFLS